MNQNYEHVSFPPIDIFCCPRFYKGLIVADGRSPLSKYLPKIRVSNCTKIINDDTPQKSDISNFSPADGLIHILSKIPKKNNIHNFKRLKVLICVCMYNESKTAIQTTLSGIYSNLQPLRQAGVSQHDIAVVLVQDGILKLVKDRVTRTYHKDENSMLEFYREQDRRDGKDKCFLEERINIIIDEIENFQRKGMGDFVKNNNDFPPSIQKHLSFVYQNLYSPNPTDKHKLKLLSCFKHTNGTKLSSHLWFFEGFCRQFNPQVCVLLDVGTKPSPMGILRYLQAFQNQNIGGVTGFMSVDANFQSQEGDEQEKKGFLKSCLFSIQKAQQFEYIISHFIDKGFQSMLGFLHVLPGAWSAYRYSALIHGEKFQQNLLQRKYFKMILDPSSEQKDYKQANMYLGEDRILSLGIYCQQSRKYYLQYVPDAIAYTDPMKSHQQLMTQRRRWINSSYFAFFYVFRNYYYNAMQSNHGFFRKYFLLRLSMLIAYLGFVNGYLIPAFYLFALYTTIVQSSNQLWVHYCAEVMTLVYVFMIVICVVGSLYGAEWMKWAHYMSYVFTFYTFLLMALVVYNVAFVYVQVGELSSFARVFDYQFQSALVFVITCLNILVYVLMVIVHLPTHFKFLLRMLIDLVSYLAYQGAYSHVMLIYAFCNVDNVSWGTKGNNGSRVQHYLIQKVKFIANWLLYNSVLAFVFLYIDFFMPRQSKKGIVLIAIGVYATTILVFKTVLAAVHQIKWMLTERCCREITGEKVVRNEKLNEFWNQNYRQFQCARKGKIFKY